MKGGSRTPATNMTDNSSGAGGDKGLTILFVLEILREKSNPDHFLQHKDILEFLRKDYDVTCSPRSLSTYIHRLQKGGYPITIKKIGCYYDSNPPQFTDAELRMMIDGVLFSRNISRAQATGLIDRLVSVGTPGFRTNRQQFLYHCQDLFYTDNEETLKNVDIVQQAINRGKKIRFLYNTYDTDFRFAPKKEEAYVFSPYRMMVSQGRYYAVGIYDPYDHLAQCRLDRMTEVALLEDAALPKRQVPELRTTTLAEYAAQHIYMFSGKSLTVRLRTEEWMMDTLVDWFGKGFKILRREGDEIEIQLRCSEAAIKYWALQYGDHVEILAPESLRQTLAESVRGMYAMYCGNEPRESEEK